MPDSTEQMYNALKVITADPRVRRYLTSHDPKALEQAEAAVESHRQVIANDGTCHEKHEAIRIDSKVRDDLRHFLMRGDVKPGMGYTAFIRWALNAASTALAGCEDDGDGFCYTHGAPGQVMESGDYAGEFVCDGRDLLDFPRA